MTQVIVKKVGFTYVAEVGNVVVGQGCSKERCQAFADELNRDSMKMEAVVIMMSWVQ